ncbi:MAG: hypothetical protein M0R22_00305 [Dehalococcoidia bacterium]|jgi:hypothetical protein|nr:hypothetical protein [Dehalococcoidia bacterium]
MTIAMKADLDAFEARQEERLGRIEAQLESLVLLLQHHGKALGELETLIPRLAAAGRPSHPAGPRGTPCPEACEGAP